MLQQSFFNPYTTTNQFMIILSLNLLKYVPF